MKSEALRQALEDELKKHKLKDIKKKLNEIGDALDRINVKSVVRSIREDRETIT